MNEGEDLTTDNIYKEIFSRNIGFITEQEQDKLRKATVGVAGLGGVGGLLVERLVRLGVGRLKITDPEAFEESNLNRQFASSMLNVGQNKTEVVLQNIKDINPQAKISYSDSGIKTEENARAFVNDCDLVIDEMDYTAFRESIILQRAARERGIYCISVITIGFGALAVVFDPKGLTIEEYNKLPSDVDLNDREKLKVPLESLAPVLPSYAAAFPPDIAQEIMDGKRPGPSNSVGAGLASILAANEAVRVILNKDGIVTAPKYTYVDLIDRQLVVGTV